MRAVAVLRADDVKTPADGGFEVVAGEMVIEILPPADQPPEHGIFRGDKFDQRNSSGGLGDKPGYEVDNRIEWNTFGYQ
jgi:hypothetical protein